VSYTVRGARWAPLYDARLDTGTRERKPALELVRRAEIVQQTGEDWNDVALAVSTVRTAKGGSGPELSPLIVRYYVPPVPQPAKTSRLTPDRFAPAMNQIPLAGLASAYNDQPEEASSFRSRPAPAQEQEAA